MLASFKSKTLSTMIVSSLFSTAFASQDSAIINKEEKSSVKHKTNNSEAILLVAFGSTKKSNAKKAYDNIEENVKKKYADKKIYWAYTSQFIRKRYAVKNIKKYSISEALEKINSDGLKSITVQSLHFTNGAEYNEMLLNVAEFKKYKTHNFSSIKIGMPLVVSGHDLENFTSAMQKNIPKERNSDTDAVIFVAHGNHTGIGDLTFLALQDKFNKINKNVLITSIEGYYSFSDTVNYVTKRPQIKNAYLMPLLITAGVHVAEDVTGEDKDSLSSLLKGKNITPRPIIKGLGEYNNVVDIFLEHINNAQEFNMK